MKVHNTNYVNYTRTSTPMYTICVTATRKRKVTRRERCAGLTGVAVADASGRTIERRERSYKRRQSI